jgi:hypothetical protein
MDRTMKRGQYLIYVDVDGRAHDALAHDVGEGDTPVVTCWIVTDSGELQRREDVKHMSNALPGEIYWRLAAEHAGATERTPQAREPGDTPAVGRYAHAENG